MRYIVVVALFCTLVLRGIEVITQTIDDVKSKKSYMENVIDKINH